FSLLICAARADSRLAVIRARAVTDAGARWPHPRLCARCDASHSTLGLPSADMHARNSRHISDLGAADQSPRLTPGRSSHFLHRTRPSWTHRVDLSAEALAKAEKVLYAQRRSR